MKKMTPAEAAAFTYRLTDGKADPEVTAATYRANANEWRVIALKAANSPNGKFRGFTEAAALEVAADLEGRAVSVPAEMRKLIA